MNINTFEMVNVISWEMMKSNWAYISGLLYSLPEEEFNKIPDVSPEAKVAAEKWGICDSILRGRKTFVNVYYLSGYLTKGEAQTLTYDE